MNVMLTPQAEKLLNAARTRHPELSAAEILESALAERVAREKESSVPQKRTREEIHVWLDELATFSDKIPPMPGETFSREMIYQDS